MPGSGACRALTCLLVLFLFAGWTACDRTTATTESRPTESGAAPSEAPGAAVTVPLVAAPRVVSLVPSATEMLDAIGAADLLVGRSMHCDWPETVLRHPSVGSGLSPDVEQVLRLRPDLVVATGAQAGVAALEQLRAAGVTVLVLPDETLADVPASLRMLAIATNRSADGEVVASQFEAHIEAVRTRTAQLTPIPTLVTVAFDPLFAAGPASRLGELLNVAGGSNVLLAGAWVQVDDETLTRLAPQAIVEPPGPHAARFWARHPTLPAVAEGRRCVVDDNGLARPGPRMLAALDTMASCLHPVATR